MARVRGFPIAKVVQLDRQVLRLKRVEFTQCVGAVADRAQDVRVAQEGGDLGIAVGIAQGEQRVDKPGKRGLREGLVLGIESGQPEVRQRALQRRDGFAVGDTDGKLRP